MKTLIILVGLVLALSGCAFAPPQPEPEVSSTNEVINALRDAGCRFKMYETRINYQHAECFDD